MFCPKCGKENNDDAKFCQECGTKLTINSDDSSQNEEEVKKGYIKDAFLAEYTSLRQEAIQRVSTQSTVIGWLIGITGTFVGLNIVSTPLGMEYPLIQNLFINPCREVFTLFAFLCAGYSLSVVLLLLFWIYQLYHMLLISDYIKNKEKDMKEYLNITLDKNIFGWESNVPKHDKCLLKIAKYAQPLSLYILSALGIIGLGISLGKIFNIYVGIVAILLLFIVLVILGIVHFKLEKWIKE